MLQKKVESVESEQKTEPETDPLSKISALFMGGFDAVANLMSRCTCSPNSYYTELNAGHDASDM